MTTPWQSVKRKAGDWFRRIPIVGQYLDCTSQHHSAALLEFGFVLFASLAPIGVVSLIEWAVGKVTDYVTWSSRFSPELAIASACGVAPLMYFFVSPSKVTSDGSRSDFPHKGSLQLACLAVFASGMLLYVLISAITFFDPMYKDKALNALKGMGLFLYIPSMVLVYTALLFKNFTDQPTTRSPDRGVDDILTNLAGRA